MKIKLLSSVLWGGEHREAGDVIEVSDHDGRWLVNRGRAIEYSEPPAIDANRAVGLKKSTPETLTKRRSYKRKPKDDSEF